VFGKGLSVESAGAIDLRWSGAQSLADRRYQLLLVVWVDYPTKFPVGEGIQAAVPVPTDYGDAGSHGLEKYDPETFARARHDQHIRKAEMVGQFFRGYSSGEANPICDSVFLGKRRKPGAIISVADNNVDRFRTV
jgi:hypothetical protein